MIVDEKILKFKHANSIEKLVIIVITNNEYEPWDQPCMLRAGEMAEILGVSRNVILDVLWQLIEKDFIISKVEDRLRMTSLSPRLIKMLKTV